MLGVKFRESTEAVTGGAAQNIEFLKGVPAGAVAWWLFIAVGANNSIAGSGIDAYVFRTDSDPYVDMVPNEVRSLFDYIYSRFGGQVPATNDLTWGFPFELLSLLIPSLGAPGQFPVVGIPSGTLKDILIRGNANLSAGSFLLGWRLSDSEPTHMPYMVGRAISGLAASTNGERYELNLQPYPTAGFLIDLGATEFTRIRIYQADAAGVTTEITDMKRDHILMMHQPYDAAGITDPILIPFERPLIFRKGSYLLVDTGAGYDGTQRLVALQFIPLRAAPGVPAPTAPTANADRMKASA